MNSVEKELLEIELKEANRLLVEAKAQLEFLTGRLTGEPWSAEFTEAVRKQKHEIDCIEFKIRNLKSNLG